MKKILGIVMLIGCFGSQVLYAQEISGQGWNAPESRPRSSSMISLAVPGNVRTTARSLPETPVPVAVQSEGGKESALPFPVLMPKTVVYPRKAIRKGWEGQTVVAAEVLPDGSVGRLALAKTSGHEMLDLAAQEAIKTWKFATESQTEDAVPQYVDIPVTFKLEDFGE